MSWDTAIGAAAALAGAFGMQIYIGRRADRRASRERQEAVMLESYRGLVEIYRLTLDFAKRKRAAGGPVDGGVELDIARAHLRPSLEMIDDNELRLLAVDALNGFATTAKGIAPDRPEDEKTDAETGADLEASRKTRDAMADRIATIARTWHGDTGPVPSDTESAT